MFTGDLKKKKRLQTVKPALNFFVAYVKKKSYRLLRRLLTFLWPMNLKRDDEKQLQTCSFDRE